MEPNYNQIISEMIKKQMAMLGPNIGLSIARKVSSIKLSETGDVLEIVGDHKKALEDAANAYVAFSGEISKLILKSVLGDNSEGLPKQ